MLKQRCQIDRERDNPFTDKKQRQRLLVIEVTNRDLKMRVTRARLLSPDGSGMVMETCHN